MELTNQVVLVTGGGSGIGAAVVQQFAQAEAIVAIAGRSTDKLVATQTASGGNTHVFALDVANREQVRTVIARIEQELGPIAVLVNNAGVNIAARSSAVLSPEDWDYVQQINTTGVFNVTHAVLPGMRERGAGLIVTVSSIAGARPFEPAGPAYIASKYAATGFTRSIGIEEAANGIRTTVIAPGEVNTPIMDRRPQPPSAAYRAQLLQPEDVAAAVVFVARLPARASVPELFITPTCNPFV